MKKIKIFSILLLLSRMLFSQYSFVVEYNNPGDGVLRYTFETSTSDFISLGGQKNRPHPLPEPALVLKINSSGEIINELVFNKPDTLLLLHYGYEKANGNFFLIGILSDTLPTQLFNLTNITYLCEITPELNLVWEKFYSIPEPYNRHLICNFIRDADSNLYVHASADSSMDGNNNVLMTMKFDKFGNQLDLNIYDEWNSDSPYNEMIFNNDSTAIYFFSDFTTGLSVYIEFIEMDLDLNITNYIAVIDWEHFNNDPITVKSFPNSTFIQANQAEMEPGTYHDLYVKIMDEEFNTLRDTLLYYPGYDYIPGFEGMGFTDPNQIWVPTFNPEPNYWSGTEVFRVHIFDSNLNLIGLKVYGDDRRYTFDNMIVTSDGGCLMTGSVCDSTGSYNDNGYIIKVMPEDILTHAEETPIQNDKDVMIYPNPFRNEIRLQTVRKDLTFDLYDCTGRIIWLGDIDDHTQSKIITGTLSQGIYFYTIQDDKRIIQSGKLIKE
jgi:hypothetical protein